MYNKGLVLLVSSTLSNICMFLSEPSELLRLSPKSLDSSIFAFPLRKAFFVDWLSHES